MKRLLNLCGKREIYEPNYVFIAFAQEFVYEMRFRHAAHTAINSVDKDVSLQLACAHRWQREF